MQVSLSVKLGSSLMKMFGNRCDARTYTPIPTSAAVMTVELMLTLRVLALCESLISSHKIVLIHFYTRWELVGKDGIT